MDELIPNFPLSFLDFTAEEILVVIIPSFTHPGFDFISYKIGQVDSGLPIEVPLWLAITLRKRGKCKIKIPDWLKVEYLEKLVKVESSEHQRNLGVLPFQFAELANIFIMYAKEDIDQPERVAALIQDLSNIREDRIRLGISSISESIRNGSSIVSTNLQNVSSMEIFSIRQFFLGSLDAFLWLNPPEEEGNLFAVEEGPSYRQASSTSALESNLTVGGNENQSRPARGLLRKHRK
jgi:GINS complex subunit 2